LSSAQKYRLETPFPEASFLVRHEGEDGVEDKGGAGEQHGGKLKAQGFSRPGGEDHDLASHVILVVLYGGGGFQDIADHEPLVGEQVGEAKEFFNFVPQEIAGGGFLWFLWFHVYIVGRLCMVIRNLGKIYARRRFRQFLLYLGI
jgi:hypothetical protein